MFARLTKTKAISIKNEDLPDILSCLNAAEFSAPRFATLCTGLDKDSCTKAGDTLTMLAIRANNLQALNWLRANQKLNTQKKNKANSTPLEEAIKHAAPIIILFLYSLGANSEKINCQTLIQLAVDKGEVEGLEMILKIVTSYPVEKRRQGLQAVLKDFANKTGTQTIRIELLLKSALLYCGRDESENNPTAYLQKMAAHGETDKLTNFLQVNQVYINNVDIWENAPLHFACMSGHFGAVCELFHHGADVNMPNALGNTPIMEAILKEEENIVIFLCATAGANLALKNHAGITALDIARQLQLEKIVSYLVNKNRAANFIPNSHISRATFEKKDKSFNVYASSNELVSYISPRYQEVIFQQVTFDTTALELFKGLAKLPLRHITLSQTNITNLQLAMLCEGLLQNSHLQLNSLKLEANTQLSVIGLCFLLILREKHPHIKIDYQINDNNNANEIKIKELLSGPSSSLIKNVPHIEAFFAEENRKPEREEWVSLILTYFGKQTLLTLLPVFVDAEINRAGISTVFRLCTLPRQVIIELVKNSFGPILIERFANLVQAVEQKNEADAKQALTYFYDILASDDPVLESIYKEIKKLYTKFLEKSRSRNKPEMSAYKEAANVFLFNVIQTAITAEFIVKANSTEQQQKYKDFSQSYLKSSYPLELVTWVLCGKLTQKPKWESTGFVHYGNARNGKILTDETIQSIFSELRCAIAIPLVELQKNKLTAKGLEPFLKIVRNMPSLRDLRLDDNPLGPVAAKYLAEYLSMATCGLTHLSLIATQLGNDGVKELATGISLNQSLIFLNLAENDISSQGLEYLLCALENHPGIKEIQLERNKISDTSIESIQDFLQRHEKYKRFDLYDNAGISYIVAKEINEILTSKQTVAAVQVGFNP